jgi:hypothetical protein
VLVVPIGAIDKPSNSVTWATFASSANGIQVYQSSVGSIDWWHGLNLPNGAILDSLQLEACDDSATGEILFGLTAGAAPGGAAANVSPVAGTGSAATPGCAFFTVAPSAPLTIDNLNKSVWLFMAWAGDFTSAVRVTGFRVFYRLQVSPAPLTASFNDVPTTHPFFQFIEALKASGITGGCQGSPLPPLFCPDNPVTRGQMAVFLAKALGLQWQ